MEEKRGAVDSALYFNLLLDQTSQTLTFKIKFATVRFNLLCLMVNSVRGTSTNWFPSRACAVLVCKWVCGALLGSQAKIEMSITIETPENIL